MYQRKSKIYLDGDFMEKIIYGIVDNKIFYEFSEQKGYDLYSHACNGCIIEDYLSIANIFCPDVIEIGKYIFFADMFEERGYDAKKRIEELEEQFQNKKDIEKWVNSKSVGDFFIGQESPSLDNYKILIKFCETIKYFWEMRLKEIFPEKEMIVEFGDGIMGELGLSVTMYEV